MADEDDEFGDFGGFEAADPIPTAVTASIPASPSPWAVFTPAPSGVPSETTVFSTVSQVQSAPGNTFSSTGDVVHEQGADVITDSIDPQTERPTADDQGYSDSQNIGISVGGEDEQTIAPTTTIELDKGAQGDNLAEAEQNKDAAEKWLENLTSASTNTAAGTHVTVTGTESASEQEPTPNAYYQDQIQSARAEKHNLEKELESLRQKQASVESGLAACQAELAEQKQKYQDIQVKHSSELEAMRQAGLDALALIVEEYKELCKVAVIEQQAASERQLKSTLQDWTEQHRLTLEEQHARHLSSIEEEKNKQEAMLAEALASQQQNQQSKFEEAIEQEKKLLREHIAESMQKQKEENEQSLMSAVEKLKEENKAALSEQKEWLGEEMKERLEVMKSAAMNDIFEKQKEVEASLKQSLDDDREKLKDQFRLLAEKSKETTLEFVKEHKKADGVVRQRQLSSLQLFLETAKSQVTDLMSEVSRDQQLSSPENR